MKKLFKLFLSFGILLFLFNCISKNKVNTSEKELSEKEQLEKKKQELIADFKNNKEKLNQKFDSLKIKEDSLFNKSTLSDLNKDAASYNQLD